MSVAAIERLPLLPTAGEVGILRRLTKAPIVHDTEGRPLCEGHARAAPLPTWWSNEAAPAPAPFEYARCP